MRPQILPTLRTCSAAVTRRLWITISSKHSTFTPSTFDHLCGLCSALFRQRVNNNGLDRSAYFCLDGAGAHMTTTVRAEGFAQDWDDIHQMVCDFGAPEMSDHVSGHMFMKGSPVEDKCSKCARLATRLHELDDQELSECVVRNLPRWREKLGESSVLQDFVRRVDASCVRRSELGSWWLSAASGRPRALSSAFVLARLHPDLHFDFPEEVRTKLDEELASAASSAPRQTDLVLFLLLCSFSARREGGTPKHNGGVDLEQRVLDLFDHLTEVEVAAAYQGLRALGQPASLLKKKTEEQFGFRL